MEEENKEKEKKNLPAEANSEMLVFYPWEGGGTFLELVSFSSDEEAAYKK